MLSRAARQKKLEKKGVDALFSRDEEKGRLGLFAANLAILVGLALWTINIAASQRPNYFGAAGLDSYTSLVLAPLGLLFVISGTGLYLSLRAMANPDPSRESTDGAEQSARIPPSPRSISTNGLEFGVVAFLESLLITALYAGILDEYGSNLGMQDWVRGTLPTAQILLSYPALIVSSGILALLVVQFLPGRCLSEKVA